MTLNTAIVDNRRTIVGVAVASATTRQSGADPRNSSMARTQRSTELSTSTTTTSGLSKCAASTTPESHSTAATTSMSSSAPSSRVNAPLNKLMFSANKTVIDPSADLRGKSSSFNDDLSMSSLP
jgi:hypothetical protein